MIGTANSGRLSLGLIVGLDPGEPSFVVATFVPILIVRRCDMSLVLRITILAGGAGFGLALLIGADLTTNNRASAMQPVRYFDPVLSGTLYTADGDGRRLLLSYYRKVAAATETKP